MSESVYILGGGRTDFKRNLKKEGKTIRHIIIEAGKKAIDDAKIDPGEIQAGAVGNFNAGQFTKQLQLGAFIPEIDPKLRGIPTMHTEAACASGALSVLLGAEWIIGGFYDVVLVVGAEQQKTMSALDGSDVLGAAADYHNEKPEYGDFMFPKLFGRIAQIYIEKYGATEADLALVAWKNYAHAKLNPLDIWTKSGATKTKLSGCLATVIRLITFRSIRKMRPHFQLRARRRRKHLAWRI